MAFMGDDACLVAMDPEPTAYAIYGLAKLEQDAVANDRHPASGRMGSAEGKTILNHNSNMKNRAPLRSVALLEIGNGTASSLEPVSQARALRTLVESCMQEGAGTNLSGLRRLATTVPCIRLVLGSDSGGVVDAVRRLSRWRQTTNQ
jgi:hypothetical protein